MALLYFPGAALHLLDAALPVLEWALQFAVSVCFSELTELFWMCLSPDLASWRDAPELGWMQPLLRRILESACCVWQKLGVEDC